MKLPKPINNLIDNFERLPGIGPKTAQRLAFYLLRYPEEELERFSDALLKLKTETRICSVCRNVGESDPCEICTDSGREQSIIAVVSSPLDALALERAGFKGKYHVLHGLIDPLNNVGPDEIYVNDLIKRLKELRNDSNTEDDKTDWADMEKNDEQHEQVEVIMATNTSMEGESTAMYISKLIRDNGFSEDEVMVTRIARGLPVGGDVEYADDTTLIRALEGRTEF